MEFTQNAVKILEKRYLTREQSHTIESQAKKMVEVAVKLCSNKLSLESEEISIEERIMELICPMIEEKHVDSIILFSKSRNKMNIEVYSSIKITNLFNQKEFENKEKVKFKTRFKEKIMPWFKKIMDMLIAEGLKKIIINLIDNLMREAQASSLKIGLI